MFAYRGWTLTHEAGRWHGRREGERVSESTYIGLLQALAQQPLLLRHKLFLLDRAIAPEPSNVLPFVSPHPAPVMRSTVEYRELGR